MDSRELAAKVPVYPMRRPIAGLKAPDGGRRIIGALKQNTPNPRGLFTPQSNLRAIYPGL
jgi:hypothetical protein